MKQLKPHARAFSLILIGLAFALWLAGRGVSVSTAASVNLAGISVVHQLFDSEKPAPSFSEALDLRAQCTTYARVVAYLLQPDVLPEEKLQTIAAGTSCWTDDRQQMLSLLQADALWKLGRHAEVCRLLQSINAGSETVRLLKLSSDKSDFEAVESYLSCLPYFEKRGIWISPFIVSPVYYRLGQHYEQQGNREAALAAYDRAAARYPVVWAAPYMAKAQLLWDQGEHDLAIQSLLKPLSASSDATATYNLWYELGSFWEREGTLSYALCAYQHAQAVTAQVPPTDLSPEMRTVLQETIGRLQSVARAADCKEVIAPAH